MTLIFRLMLERKNAILWIVPETKGGIRTYVEGLVPLFGGRVRPEYEILTPQAIAELNPEVVHVQHEYGLFGSKIPGRYLFPAWFRKAKAANPHKKWVATAHSVIEFGYRFPYEGRGWQKFPRFILNGLLTLPRNPILKLWGQKTWGGFDGVIVLHRQQVAPVVAAGCSRVVVIPLPVARIPGLREVTAENRTKVVLFGYFSPDKGQDIAIRAWKIWGERAPKLVLAGGVRRPEDQPYYDQCRKLIEQLGLSAKVEITGYVPNENLESIYAESKLVLAPFRASTGSASIATAFSYGAAVLASDLLLNRELDHREPGCVTFFKSESSENLAEVLRALVSDEGRLSKLREAGRRYAEKFSSEKIAQLHLDFYRQVLDGRAP